MAGVDKFDIVPLAKHENRNAIELIPSWWRENAKLGKEVLAP